MNIEEVAADLRRTLLVSARILRSHTASEYLTAPQFSVLAFLYRRGESTPSQVAAFEHVSAPVMSRMLDRLEQSGWVQRRQHPEDGRQVLASLTDQGRAQVEQCRRERDQWLRERLADADERELALIAEANEVLVRLLLRTPPH